MRPSVKIYLNVQKSLDKTWFSYCKFRKCIIFLNARHQICIIFLQSLNFMLICAGNSKANFFSKSCRHKRNLQLKCFSSENKTRVKKIKNKTCSAAVHQHKFCAVLHLIWTQNPNQNFSWNIQHTLLCNLQYIGVPQVERVLFHSSVQYCKDWISIFNSKNNFAFNLRAVQDYWLERSTRLVF